MTERRYERLHPAELRRAIETAPIAYVPLGTLEFHGEHLPAGVDSFEAHGLCLRAAERSGGVVLPPVYLASGCLDLPFTLSYDNTLVHSWATSTVAQLGRHGFRAVVVLTGHGPLDLNHVLKRACAEVEVACSGLGAYALCWLELNAARLTEPERGDPTTVDHAARIETSWMLELEPDLVHLDRLADDPDATFVGIYGRNPRFTASADLGRAQIEAAAELLATRARALLDGDRPDTFADLRRFVEFGWPEAPVLRGSAGSDAALGLLNPGTSSRYVSGLGVAIDGVAVDPRCVVLANDSPGETGVPVRACELGAESGFYVRRRQEATVTLVGTAVTPGVHRVEAEIGLAGVTSIALDEEIAFI